MTKYPATGPRPVPVASSSNGPLQPTPRSPQPVRAIPAPQRPAPEHRSADDGTLARRAREALKLLERYRHIEPVAAMCGLQLRPAAQDYLEGRTRTADSDTPPPSAPPQTPTFVRRAQAATHLRTRMDLWSALLSRDIPGFLTTPEHPSLRGPSALARRASSMEALTLAHVRAGTPLPYGGMLVDDLRSARFALQGAGTQGGPAPRSEEGQLADAGARLERELATFTKVLVALLGRDHADALRTTTPPRPPC